MSLLRREPAATLHTAPCAVPVRRDIDSLALPADRHTAVSLPVPPPFESLSCQLVTAAGEVWVGGEHGAARWNDGVWEVFSGRRWLPADAVLALIETNPGVAVATSAGWVAIDHPTWTLPAKAQHYEQLTDARHRRFGYVTGCALEAPGDVTRWRPHIDDNDGLWTAMYVAAQSFRFAVTGEPEARAKAREGMAALLFLEAVTPIAGFPARAVTRRDESEFGAHPDGEWHATDDGAWEWKGDTSSDELDGHYFVWPIYHALVADAAERVAIESVVRRTSDHLLDHGLYLCDLDGAPTRWGVWAPERLNADPRWRAERGLNSLEILAYLKVAECLTGERRYADAARELVDDHHYALNAVTQKAMPGDFPGAEDNHSDDELAFLAYYPLLALETDVQRRAVYLASLERSWRIERPEACPLTNIIYGALSGRPCDLDATAGALADIPLDLVDWRMTNAGRTDLRLAGGEDRFARRQLTTPLPWRERPLHKWNGNPYRFEGGNDLSEECGTFWLLPYWMARWHGLLGWEHPNHTGRPRWAAPCV
ncbi:MAG: hypothetical protein HZB16_17510 [Armatimonadetes bacterium]|nr:hypothetical protein [Armatimonadota bacterium]